MEFQIDAGVERQIDTVVGRCREPFRVSETAASGRAVVSSSVWGAALDALLSAAAVDSFRLCRAYSTDYIVRNFGTTL